MSIDKKNIARGACVPVEEKSYSGELSTLGKFAYFSEYFDKVKLDERDFQDIVPLNNISQCSSFKAGYERAKALVENGFTKENYYAFLVNLRKKIKTKVEELRATKKHM